MGAHMLNDPNHELKEKEDRKCDVCTPNGCICPSTWANKSNHIENRETEEEEDEEEKKKKSEESDWDADFEEAQDYCARVPAPMKRPRQSPKVLMLQLHKCTAGWAAGVWPKLPPKPNLVPKNMYAQQEQEQ